MLELALLNGIFKVCFSGILLTGLVMLRCSNTEFSVRHYTNGVSIITNNKTKERYLQRGDSDLMKI